MVSNRGRAWSPPRASSEDDHGALCRDRRLAGTEQRLRGGRHGQDRVGWFRGLGLEVTRVGLEAGPLSQWLYVAMRDAGLPVELLETRHVRDAFKAMPVKTDRKDARG